MKYGLILMAALFMYGCAKVPSTPNVVAQYLDGAELQCECSSEGSHQAAEISRALNDMLDKPPVQLRQQRYADYRGTQNAWSITTLLEKYYVPVSPSAVWRNDSEEFYRDVSSPEAKRAIRKQLDFIEHNYSTQ